MRSLLWLVLLLVIAVVAALTLGDNDGLVSVYWGGWRVDMSANFFVVAILSAGTVAVVLFHAVSTLLDMPERARQWRSLRRERAAQASLREALAEYFGARYARSLKAGRRAMLIQDDAPLLVDNHEFRMLASLLVAGSLHRMQDRSLRDEALDAALSQSRRTGSRAVDDGARLLGAEWALEERDGDRAAALLADLTPGASRRTQAQRLQLQVARLARRPLDALRTARMLANHRAFTPGAARGLLRSLAFELIDDSHDADQLRRAWRSLDGADQRDAFVAARAARRAATLRASDDGRTWLRPFWDRIGDLSADDRQQIALASIEALPGLGPDWLPRLEAAQRAFATVAAVQAAVGMALADRRLYGKARPALELAAADPALDAKARRQSWRALAALAREEGDHSRAADCDRAAANID
jgi:HemY protein